MMDIYSQLPLWDNIWQSDKSLLVIDDSQYYDILLYIGYLNDNASSNKITILVNNNVKYSFLKYFLRKRPNITINLDTNINVYNFYAYVPISFFDYKHINKKQFNQNNKQDLENNIKTCFSFYKEQEESINKLIQQNNYAYYDISAKDIYDNVLVAETDINFSTIDNTVLYPLSKYICEEQSYHIYNDPYKALSYVSQIDIIITCDNLTAQLAILLGKYTIIIADQRLYTYSHIKHKKCITININDKKLYYKIGKAYRNFVKDIKQNIYESNKLSYNYYQNNDYQKLYSNAVICMEQYQYLASISLLNDIPLKVRNIDILQLQLDLYFKTKSYLQYIETAEFLEQKKLLTHQQYIKYLRSLQALKKYKKVKEKIIFLYQENIFTANNPHTLDLLKFINAIIFFDELDIAENFINDVKSLIPENMYIKFIIDIAHERLNFIKAQELIKKASSYDMFYHITPVWQGQKNADIVIFFPTLQGESILYLSIIQYILSVQKRVTLCCDQRLHSLFKRSFLKIYCTYCNSDQHSIQKFLEKGKYDYQTSTFNVPSIIKLDLSKHKPKKFLKVDADLLNGYRKRLKKIANGKTIIGISNALKKRIGYIDWKYWQPILSLDNVLFVNLEYDAKSKQYLQKLTKRNNYNLTTWQEPHPIIEFDEFTTLVSACDMVICASTTLKHQAGGLGIPSFILLTDKPLYFDKIGGDKSVWYENQYYIRATDYQTNNKRPNYKKMMIDASEKIKNYIDQNFS